MAMTFNTYARNNETRKYVKRIKNAGKTLDAFSVLDIDNFVTGCKDLGVWNSMVCWPLRSTQNTGTNTAFSLGGLGTFDGTLLNNPLWSTNGMVTNGTTNQKIYVGDWNSIFGSAPVNNMSFGLVVVNGSAAMGHYQGANTGYEIALQWTTDSSTPIGGAKNVWANWGYSWFNELNFTNPLLGPAWVYSRRISSTQAELGLNNTILFSKSDNASRVSTTPINHSASLALPALLTNGRGDSNDALSGTSSFYYMIRGEANNISLYNLYKTTLGKGLGLP
jgi:hypothetical protein